VPRAANASILLVRAAVARDILPESLVAAGATLTIAEAYRTIIPQDSIEQLQKLLMTDPPDAITFTSASTARNLVALLEAGALKVPEGVCLASIGPITSLAMRDLALEPTCEAREATVPALADALVQWELRRKESLSG
jgi:uroporphyrinogen-III synthase